MKGLWKMVLLHPPLTSPQEKTTQVELASTQLTTGMALEPERVGFLSDSDTY
jgi:hypothetical protein